MKRPCPNGAKRPEGSGALPGRAIGAADLDRVECRTMKFFPAGDIMGRPTELEEHEIDRSDMRNKQKRQV